MSEHVPQGKEGRRLQAELAESEDQRLELVLNQALDEWLRAYVVNLLKNITAQPNDAGAVERALHGAKSAIAGWRNARERIRSLTNE